MTIAVLAASTIPSPARAEPGIISLDTLIRSCDGPTDIDYGFCAGYVEGVVDMLAADPDAGFCLLNNARSQQIIDLMKQDRDFMNSAGKLPAPDGLKRLLSIYYPCR